MARKFKILDLDRLSEDEQYPPLDFSMSENGMIYMAWDEHLRTNPLSKPRNNFRRPVMHLDRSRLKYIVPPEEDLLVLNSKTFKVIAVVQKLIGDKTVVRTFNGSIIDRINKCKSEML